MGMQNNAKSAINGYKGYTCTGASKGSTVLKGDVKLDASKAGANPAQTVKSGVESVKDKLGVTSVKAGAGHTSKPKPGTCKVGYKCCKGKPGGVTNKPGGPTKPGGTTAKQQKTKLKTTLKVKWNPKYADKNSKEFKELY